MYAKACKKVTANRSRDETFMANVTGDADILVAVSAIKKQARKV